MLIVQRELDEADVEQFCMRVRMGVYCVDGVWQ